ncbi:transposable element Tc1 transposase [Trichonephila clavipes]|nr:transposable element Tc1 transposase [Trichonephila clavipes]
MDRTYCIQVLKENLRASAEKLGIEEEYQFYLDNDPKHSSQNTRLWLLYNCPKVIKTPAQSADLNPIEHLWGIFEKRLRECHFWNRRQVEEILREEWSKIDQEVTEKLVKSIPQRLTLLLRSYFTKFSDEAHFCLKGYVNKQNCRIWSEANPQVYVETPLHPEKLTVWYTLWAGGILLQKR